MDETQLLKQIEKIHLDRSSIESHALGFSMYELNANRAKADFDQWKRLSQYTPTLGEEGFSRVKFFKKTIENIYEMIENNLGICLTSNHRYLHEFARLIAEADRYDLS